jgi:hypothetical protein
MELPDDVLKIIKEYSMPITRPDWRKGCYYNRYPYKVNNKYFTFKYILRLCHHIHKSPITELLMNMLLTEILLLYDNI